MKYFAAKSSINLRLANGRSADDISWPDTVTSDNNTPENLVLDRDADGIVDSKNQRPDKPSLPLVSNHLGVQGEYSPHASRLPLMTVAGFCEGKKSLPATSRVIANVVDFVPTAREALIC